MHTHAQRLMTSAPTTRLLFSSPSWPYRWLALASRTIALALMMVLAGCASRGGGGSGGYYKGDGPGANPPANLASIPDAVPRIEPFAGGANKPYDVFGVHYVPDLTDRPYTERGTASWYGRMFDGHMTSDGETYNMYGMTAAHPTLPIPSYARVTNLANGRSVIVRINDRGPFLNHRIIDLSYAAAYKLGYVGNGTGEVEVQKITRPDIRTMIAEGRIPSGNANPDTNPPLIADSNSQEVASQPVSEPDALVAENMPAPTPVAARPAAPVSIPNSDIQAYSTPGVYLQFGAFSDANNAKALTDHINQALAGSQLKPVTIFTQRGIYHVRMGPYPQRGSAETAANQVVAKLGMRPVLSFSH